MHGLRALYKHDDMEDLVKEEFTELTNYKASTCISIYLPTHKSGAEINEKQDLIVFKNNLQECARQLVAKGKDKVKVDQLLEPAYELLKHDTFWYQLSEGLAVFIADGFFKAYRVPVKVKEELHVNSSFHLSPLVPYVTHTGHFYLLVFSKDACNLYKGNGYGMQKVEVEGLPLGMDDVIHFEEKDERKLFRGGGNAPGAEANFHGHGSGLADEKEYISQYLKEVDQTLWTEVLANEKAPLILSSVEYMVGYYRQISRYKHIAEDNITGNYDHEGLNTLYERARKIAEPLLKQEAKKALLNYYNQVATDLTTSMPEKIIPASYYAQISDLFVLENYHVWGKFDEVDNKLTIHPEKQDGDECLVNKAIVNTLANGGAVYILPAEKMPKESSMAAFLRFKA